MKKVLLFIGIFLLSFQVSASTKYVVLANYPVAPSTCTPGNSYDDTYFFYDCDKNKVMKATLCLVYNEGNDSFTAIEIGERINSDQDGMFLCGKQQDGYVYLVYKDVSAEVVGSSKDPQGNMSLPQNE